MVDELYDFTYKLWGKVHYFLPPVSRDVPPNSFSMLYCHSLFKGSMPKHRDLNLIQKETTGEQKIMCGSPIMTLSLFAPMSFVVWGLEKRDTNHYASSAEKKYIVKRESHILEPGSVLIRHPHDDE
jgi:hypothetical protein